MTPAQLRAAAAIVIARADHGLPHLNRIAEALLEAAERATPEPTTDGENR